VSLVRPSTLALMMGSLVACPSGGAISPGGAAAGGPVAESYELPSNFKGEWLGESAGRLGILTIEALGERRYYGRFESEDGATKYVANMQQAAATRPGDEVPSAANLLTFSWQDGRGGLGDGWLLINREDSALTGVIYFGERQTNSAGMSFVRVDE
jgi:hypothetical protein